MSRFQLMDNDYNLDDNDNDMIEVVQEGEASSSKGPHRMRITSGGQVAGYVNFALTFLKENPDRSLVLHTLPPANSEASSSKSSSSSLNTAILATPKLVSVVEKIKREYMSYINSKDVGKGKNKAVGIWQYNESGTLSQGQEQQELGLESILEGRTKPKMKHQPYMQITLCTKPLGLEEGVKGRNVTCQYVMIRRKNANSKPRTKAGTSKEGAEMDTAQLPKDDESGDKKDMGGQAENETGEKRKMGSSQASQSDTIRGGKKRKK